MTDALIDRDAAQAVSEARHGDPFAVLGPHRRGGGWTVTAFVPGAVRVEALIGIRRAEKQPLDLPNCGSVFKRPAGRFAGDLIERCGLKGLRSGSAMISEKHANFIVNTGGATAEDVRRLIALAQRVVYEREQVLLEPEVIFAGEFSTPLFVP